MGETLTIRNFGPIKDITLNLKKFNVIIGENATGKSTIAKLLAMCRYFSYIVSESTFFGNSFENGLEANGLSEYFKLGSYIYYECEHYSIEINRIWGKLIDPETGEIENEGERSTYLLEPKSIAFKKLYKEYEKLKEIADKEIPLYNLGWNPPTNFFLNDVKNVLDNPFYLYTERGLQSIFSLSKDSIGNISNSLYNQFAQLYEIAASFKSETSIPPLGIIYKHENGQGYIKKKEENDLYQLSKAASGYQSAIPIVLTIEYYNEIKKRNKTFIIEEPELNLFPSAQYKLIQYFADKIINKGSSILLTTHSPYILTSLNNLMFAYQTGKEHSEEVDKIIEKKYWLDPDQFSAYKLNSNDEFESILDKEGLIKTEKIDAVSGILNREFNEIFDIELSIKK